jgi:hypothetical protein
MSEGELFARADSPISLEGESTPHEIRLPVPGREADKFV